MKRYLFLLLLIPAIAFGQNTTSTGCGGTQTLAVQPQTTSGTQSLTVGSGGQTLRAGARNCNTGMPFRNDLAFYSNERDGDSLLNEYGQGALILRPTISSVTATANTSIIPTANTIWAIKCRFRAAGSHGVLAPATTGGFRFGLNNTSGQMVVSWGNKEGFSANGVGDTTNFYLWVLYNGKLYKQPAATSMSNASILNIIATVTPSAFVAASPTWGTPNKVILYGGMYINSTIFSYSIDYADSYIGELVSGNITWRRKHIFNAGEDIVDYAYVYDVLQSDSVLQWNGVAKVVKFYSQYGSSYPLDYGYSLYKCEGYDDLCVPYLISGIPNTTTTIPAGYVFIKNVPGNLTKHNFYDSKLRFYTASFDRSDTTIFNSYARVDYDAANTKDWKIKYINALYFHEWNKIVGTGNIFIKATINSVDYESRNLLEEVFSYTTAKSGSDYTRVLNYTKDYSIIYDPSYLLNPYTDIYKITANSNSVFRFNLNNSIVYSKADISARLNGLAKVNPDEDTLTGYMRYWSNNAVGGMQVLTAITTDYNSVRLLNSYMADVCSGVALISYHVLTEKNVHILTGPSHTNNYIPNRAFLDFRLKAISYKDRYVPASLEEMKADTFLWLEPIRKTTPNTAWYQTNLYSSAYHIKSFNPDPSFEYPTIPDNLVMQLPAGSTLTLPFRSTITPRNYLNAAMWYYATARAEVPSGVNGVINMPLIPYRITGTASIMLNDTAFTLPTDTAALNLRLQKYMFAYDTILISSNTGGVTIDYFINHRRALLYNNNTLTTGVISGDVSISRVKTTTPCPTFTLSVNKGNATNWSITYDQYFTKNMSFRHPITQTYDDNHDRPTVDFFKTGTRPMPIRISNKTVNTITSVTAGTEYVDKCYSPQITPKVYSFSGISLTITLTAFDTGASIYYTTDGTTPDVTKTLYTAPFNITASKTLKAICVKTNYENSDVISRMITKL